MIKYDYLTVTADSLNELEYAMDNAGESGFRFVAVLDPGTVLMERRRDV